MRKLCVFGLLAFAAQAFAQMGAPTGAGSPGTSLGSSPPKTPLPATAVCERFKDREKLDCERKILGKAEPGPATAPGKPR